MRTLLISAILALAACSQQAAKTDTAAASSAPVGSASNAASETVKADLRAACVSDGEAEATCACMVDAFALVLEPAEMETLLQHTRAKDDQAAQQLLTTRVMGDSAKMTTFGTAMAKCG
jgi:hypothetical protein